MHNFSWKTSFWIILIFTVLIVICIKTGDYNLSPYKAYQGLGPSPILEIGNTFILKIPKSKLVILSVTKDNLNEAQKLILAHDSPGLAKMAAEYRIYLLEQDTRVKIIEKGFEITRLRILDGPYVTMDGWTYDVFLK